MKTESLKLVCLIPFHHVIRNNLWGKFSGQQKSILRPKENHQNNIGAKRGASLELFKKFNIFH
jgi:hypothetical protein